MSDMSNAKISSVNRVTNRTRKLPSSITTIVAMIPIHSPTQHRKHRNLIPRVWHICNKKIIKCERVRVIPQWADTEGKKSYSRVRQAARMVNYCMRWMPHGIVKLKDPQPRPTIHYLTILTRRHRIDQWIIQIKMAQGSNLLTGDGWNWEKDWVIPGWGSTSNQ